MTSADAWSILAVAAFWGWVALTLRFIFAAFPGAGGFRSRPALLWGLASLLAAAAWVTALRNA